MITIDHPYWLGLAVTGGMIDCVNSSDETDSGHWTRICIYGGILKLYATVFVIKLICSFKDHKFFKVQDLRLQALRLNNGFLLSVFFRLIAPSH